MSVTPNGSSATPDRHHLGLRLGMACHWSRPRQSTWSGTPWHLMRALEEVATLIDLGTEVPELLRNALRLANARHSSNGWNSTWRYSATAHKLVESRLRRSVQSNTPDVVLEVQDLGVLEVPFMVMQDLSYSLLLERFGSDGVPHFRSLSKKRVEALRRRQETIYQQASALLPMSHWMADGLRRIGVPARNIRVVNPGVNTPVSRDQPIPVRRQGNHTKLLFVGRDFDTKGGAQVLSAFRLLRREMGTAISLTIAGPNSWPVRSTRPQGVAFLGKVPQQTVSKLMDSHDLFVMPSRFEGFGIAFAEALVHGLPCIGRNDCAMPEIIDVTSGGRLVQSESADELAELILSTLDDDALYAACADAAILRREHFTWDRAARQVVATAREVLSGGLQ